MTTTQNLQSLVDEIEKMDKIQHIQILQIIKSLNPALTINDTKKGAMINMTCVSEETLEKLAEYIRYITKQRLELDKVETEKKEIYEQFFMTESTGP